MVQKLWHFNEGVDLAPWWSFIGKGLRLQPAEQACFDRSGQQWNRGASAGRYGMVWRKEYGMVQVLHRRMILTKIISYYA